MDQEIKLDGPQKNTYNYGKTYQAKLSGIRKRA